MRICHVIESSSGGSSQVVLDLLRAQLASGDDVTLIYSPIRAEEAFLEGVGRLEKLRVLPFPMQRRVEAADLGAAFGLRRLLTSAGPFDIIHAHSSKAGALVRLARLFQRDAKIVYTPHAFVTMAKDASPIYGAVEWLASWFCDAIVTGSQQELHHARALRLPQSRLRLIPMGVRLEPGQSRAAARAALGLPEDVFAVGFVGRLVAQKNPLRLPPTFAAVARARPDIRFVVVGDGYMRAELDAGLRAHNMETAVEVVSHPRARDLMPAFDCLVCTSDYESFGLIFPEALSAGAPLVTPPVGVAEDAVGDGATGRLTSFEPADIAKGVLEIASLDASARAEMSKACIERSKIFDFKLTAQRTRDLYQDLLRARGLDQ